MSWQLAILLMLALVLIVGGVWFERSRPPARIIAAVAALAALGVAGRLLLAPIPNLVGTTDVALLAGYTLGGPAGFAVGALSALVSNFWLGQGPWTPWQMAGWGIVGVGGAALAALTARRLGRIGLAAAAAVAGLAYGALLDLSVMVNFGGEQSLDRYLALSARAIPFNILHAAGNAAIMLAAGPALVRILDRYRQRFEIIWKPSARAGAVVASIALGLALAVPALLGPPAEPALAGESRITVGQGAGHGSAAAPAAGAAAEAPAAEVAGSGDGVGWLRSTQNSDGGFGTSDGSSSNAGMTGWAMLGLEAAGRNPLDLRRAGNSPVDYLRRNVGEVTSTGDLERTILALRGAGLSAQRFAGRDLLAELRSRQSSSGSYEKQVNLTAFAILARVAAGEGAGSLRGPTSWLKDAQNRDGGWGSVRGASSEPDSTGAVLQALALSGGGRTVRDGARWLRRDQHANGGWSLTSGADPNSQSTAWAVQGLVAAGVDPDGVRKGKQSGIGYLQARQAGDGHFAYSTGSDQTPVWVTAQALTAIERRPFPIPPVARKPRSGGGSGSGGSGNSASGGSGGSGSGAAGGGGRSGLGFGAGGRGGKGGGSRSTKKPGANGRSPQTTELPREAAVAEGTAAEVAAQAAAEDQADGEDSKLAPALLGLNLLAAAGLGMWLSRREHLI